MIASMSFVVGVAIGGAMFAVLGRGIRRDAEPPQRPTVLGWCALAFGVIALVAVGLTFAKVSVLPGSAISIASAAAAVVVGVGALVKRDRHWPTWAALITGGVPAVFWIVFAAAELVGPPH
jgi:hypothetical protein